MKLVLHAARYNPFIKQSVMVSLNHLDEKVRMAKKKKSETHCDVMNVKTNNSQAKDVLGTRMT